MARTFDAAVREAAATGTAGRARACALDLGGRFVVAVAEGAGASGAPAADAVIAAVQAAVRKVKFDPTSTSAWTALLTDVDDELWRRDAGGETAAVVLFTDGDVIIGASVGDTQAAVTGRGAWMELTRRQRKDPLLGSGNAEPVAFEVRLKAAELTLLTATRALWKRAKQEALSAAVTAGNTAEEDADAVLEAAGVGEALQEDVAAVLLRLRR